MRKSSTMSAIENGLIEHAESKKQAQPEWEEKARHETWRIEKLQ